MGKAGVKATVIASFISYTAQQEAVHNNKDHDQKGRLLVVNALYQVKRHGRVNHPKEIPERKKEKTEATGGTKSGINQYHEN